MIGFDETRLLASLPEPESPRELLHKSINVEARMPVRILTDTLRLACMASTQAVSLNPQLSFLKDSRAIAALAYMMELLSPIQAVSPRVAKHMVNNALFYLAQIQQSEQPMLEDWCAVLRLLSLHITLPQLRSQGDTLSRVLQRNQVDGMAELTELIFTVETDKTKAARQAESIRLVLIVYNATRIYSPANQDWSSWVMLWAARALGELENQTMTPEQPPDKSFIPDFNAVNYLNDGLQRMIEGKPHTALASISDLLAGLAGDTTPEKIHKISKLVAAALLPLIALRIIKLTAKERQRFLTTLWQAANDNTLVQVFEFTDKGDFLVCLSAWMLQEESPWPTSTQENFTEWWLSLAAADLNISPARRMRLLTLLPAGCFHLVDILAYAALVDEGLGSETWLAAYAGGADSDLKFNLNHPVEQFLDSNTGSESVKRYWPAIPVESPDFIALLTEHCHAWRRLKLRSAILQTPLEYLLFEERAFADYIRTPQAEPILKALVGLFFDGEQWEKVNWPDLLIFFLNQNSSLSRVKKLKELRKRFLPLLKKPILDPRGLQLQLMLAAIFPNKQIFNRLAKNLILPLSEEEAEIILDNIKSWASIYTEAAHRYNLDESIEQYQAELVKYWVARLAPETWDKVFKNSTVPDAWRQLHLAHL